MPQYGRIGRNHGCAGEMMSIHQAKARTEYMGMSVRSTVTTIFEQVAREQQRTPVPLSDDLKLLESGLDSLSFAIIVAKLEVEVGFDPFSAEELVEFPITFGDFVRLYETPPRCAYTDSEAQSIAAVAHTAPNRMACRTPGRDRRRRGRLWLSRDCNLAR
jgi:acyl carrier protein